MKNINNKKIYNIIFSYLTFDEFCVLKEYSYKITQDIGIPSWNIYFKMNNIKISKINSNIKLFDSINSVRLFFINEDKYYIDRKIYLKYGIDIFDEYDPDFKELYFHNKKIIKYLIKNNLIRKPYYLTLKEIIERKYYKLFAQIVYNKFIEIDLTELLSDESFLPAVRIGIHTGKGYIFRESENKIIKTKNLKYAIIKGDIKEIYFLINKIGLSPSESDIELIRKYIPYLENIMYCL